MDDEVFIITAFLTYHHGMNDNGLLHTSRNPRLVKQSMMFCCPTAIPARDEPPTNVTFRLFFLDIWQTGTL